MAYQGNSKLESLLESLALQVCLQINLFDSIKLRAGMMYLQFLEGKFA